MIRRTSSISVCDTVSKRPRLENPNVMNRSSPTEWSGSLVVADNGSRKTVAASSKDTPCFFRFSAALSESQANRTGLPFHAALSHLC